MYYHTINILLNTLHFDFISKFYDFTVFFPSEILYCFPKS